LNTKVFIKIKVLAIGKMSKCDANFARNMLAYRFIYTYTYVHIHLKVLLEKCGVFVATLSSLRKRRGENGIPYIHISSSWQI